MLRVAALAVSATLAAIGLTSATVPSSAADQAPECVTVPIRGLPQPDGTVRVTWEKFCGNGPGKDSPMQDWANGKPEQLDGAYAIGRGCGSKASPCVIFLGG